MENMTADDEDGSERYLGKRKTTNGVGGHHQA